MKNDEYFRLYRNHYGDESESLGFSWHRTLTAAVQAAKQRDTIDRAEVFYVNLTRDKFIDLLNRVAAHPDTGGTQR